MVFIYVLQLEQAKYYIGKTNNPTFRLENHFNSNGSAWTKKYKPIKVIELLPNLDDYDEDKYTIKYMDKYGMDNVRGGSFCEINLNENNIITLNQMINGTNNKCFTCGEEGHFVNNCKKKENPIKVDNSNENCDCHLSYFSPHRRSKCLLNNVLTIFDEDKNITEIIKQEVNYGAMYLFKNILSLDNEDKNITEIKQEVNDDVICYWCGREGHFAKDCYAKTYVSGNKIEYEETTDEECVWCCEYCDRTFTTAFGAGVHEKSCKEKNSKQDTCYRCGREGHYATTCYASKHIKGYYIK